ncbi:MAG TPA: cytochrome d ubiquinol oxidase subunit II, partial [Gemmatimonadaceae bacterium]|nr:cytochrome d ubiquinol oxidase subunit II [Gemmatimonadaceae bacterium]
MVEILRNLTIAEVTAWVIVVALNAYVLFGGADFGGGVWDLFASGPRREKQRTLVADAIGPIWEANHVWLIVVVVLLFVCFPRAFSGLATILHIPLSLLLIGIVLRGSAFVFRAYSYGPRAEQRRWGQVFAVSSLITPIVLGICVGAVVSGGVGEALSSLDVSATEPLAVRPSVGTGAAPTPGFASLYVRPWLTPFALAVGAMTIALFSFLAAVYLTVEAEGDPELQHDFRQRALLAAGVSVSTALIALVGGGLRGGVMGRLVGTGWSLPLLSASALAAAVAVWALVRRRYRLARIAAGAEVTLVLWGWALAQFPLIIPPSLTIDGSAAPRRVLAQTLVVLAGGAVVLIPSLWYLIKVFKT